MDHLTEKRAAYYENADIAKPSGVSLMAAIFEVFTRPFLSRYLPVRSQLKKMRKASYPFGAAVVVASDAWSPSCTR